MFSNNSGLSDNGPSIDDATIRKWRTEGWTEVEDVKTTLANYANSMKGLNLLLHFLLFFISMYIIPPNGFRLCLIILLHRFYVKEDQNHIHHFLPAS